VTDVLETGMLLQICLNFLSFLFVQSKFMLRRLKFVFCLLVFEQLT